MTYNPKYAESGLCCECGKEPAPGRVRCRHCLDLNSRGAKKYRERLGDKYLKYMTDRRHAYQDMGRCACGAILDEDADKGYTYCVNCRQRVLYE